MIIGTGLYAKHLSKLTGMPVTGAREFLEKGIPTNEIVIICCNPAPTFVSEITKLCTGFIIDVTPSHRGDSDWAQYADGEMGDRISLPGCMATAIKDVVDSLPEQPFYALGVTLGSSVAGKVGPIMEFTQLGVNARHAQYDEIQRFMGDTPFSFNPVFGGFEHGIIVSLPLFSGSYKHNVLHGNEKGFDIRFFKDYTLINYEMDNFTRLDKHVLDCLKHFDNYGFVSKSGVVYN